MRGICARIGVAGLAAALLIPLVGMTAAHAAGPCDPPANPIVCENSKPGVPPSYWQVQGAGDAGLQGFGTDISVNKGDTVNFKVSSVSTWHYDILRLGWYGGNGARLIAQGLTPQAPQPQSQPPCITDTDLGLVDCGNWDVSASYQVPSAAVSGVYIALLTRDDTGGQSQITFVVRDDSSHSAMVVQTSDTTWEAYNTYGGFSLYQGPNAAHRAYKVSYNRPFITVANDSRNWWPNAELPMWQYLERNGYDISYISGVDTDRHGALLMNHQIFVSSGHDEYWSGQQRANVEAARDAGVNLAFFSGNTMYWKTRYEPSVDGSNTPYRTIVTYKESLDSAVTDPADPPTWTGLWRDTRFSPPADGGRPENSVLGQVSTVICCSDTITVGAADAKMRLWRNTSLTSMAAGTSYALTAGSLGYEFDTDVDNGAQPPGLIRVSTTATTQPSVIKDFAETTGPGTVTHHITEYRAPSGALVFDAGTVNWSWTLMGSHTGDPADPKAQQATVNLFADMGVQPTTPDAGLVTATKSTDTTAPTSVITTPLAGTTLAQGSVVTVAGTATDAGGGVVAGVEISTDGGATWHPATTGRASWTYTWTVAGNGPVNVKTRAVDDSGNLETPSAGVNVNVNCPCRLFPTGIPSTPASGDNQAVEVGTRFHADANGYISGIRFYKGTTNTGVHIGNLWTTSGTLLATATFSSESASGWQQVNFSAPVAITANTDYIASYHSNTGHYADDPRYFFSPYNSAPLHASASSASTPNGVYSYGAASSFPTSTNLAQNYWVDVVFTTDATPPGVLSTSPNNGTMGVAPSATVSATFTKPVQGSSVSLTLTDSGNATVPGTLTFDDPTSTVTLTPYAALNPLTTYTATVSGVLDKSGNPMPSPYSWSFTTTSFAVCPCTLFPVTSTPVTAATSDTHSVELGLKFRADANGYVTGVRFYKGSTNTGTHTGTLWSSSGTQLATATFSTESATGWQQVNFSTWVPVTANAVYIVSYHTSVGHYAVTPNALTNGVDNAPLHALANGAQGPNAVYAYATSTTFPTSSGANANYFVDVVYGLSNAAPSVTRTTPASGSTNVPTNSTVTASFGKPVVGSSVQVGLTDSSGATVPGAVTFNSATSTATLTPASALNQGTAYTATVSGAVDGAGVPMAAPYSWSFTTAGSPTCPCTIFAPSATPVTAAANDAKAVELGVKFRTDLGGYITGVRFYKGSTNTGTHIGNLWSSAGTLLATATFSGESASGWQQVNFSTPVLVTAGTTYIASYHTNVGRYSVTAGGLTSAIDAPPLHALANGVDGSNGVYAYSTPSVYPATAANGTNYFVDVVFNPSPSVVARSPYPGSTSVPASSTVTARLSEAVNPASINFSVVDSSSVAVAGATAYDSGTNTVTFTPTAALSPSTTYTATISGATDLSGEVMAAPYTWAFTTIVQPPTVISTTPATGGTATSLIAPVRATFGQAVVPGSINFSLVDQNGAPVAGTLSYNTAAKQASFVPSAPLAQLQSFTATVSGAMNSFGNVMAAPYPWSFTTPQAAPTVIAANPSGDDSAQVAFDAAPSVTFSQAVSPASIQLAVVDQDGNLIPGSLSYDTLSNTATFTPTTLLNPDTTFTVTVSGATNLGGVPLASPFVFSFTTAAPQVFLTARTPAVGATDVALNTTVSGTFSQAIVPASVSFVVKDSTNTVVPGSLVFRSGLTVAKFTPTSPLAPGATYTVTVSGAVTADGQTMPVPVSWSFTTTTPPSVSAQTPVPDATGVAMGATISAGFNRPVSNGTTVFSVLDPLDNPVAGNITLDTTGTIATFTPTSPLTPATTYTVTVSGAASPGGSVMAAPVSWSFTTALRPTMTSQTPPPNAVGVAAVGSTVAAGFSQAVTGATVTVADPAGNAVAGTTAYNSVTNTATFTPNGPFNASTTYTVTVAGATNSSGAVMLPVTWVFTTVSYGCPCTLMAPTATPTVAAASDTKAVELGLKFKADVNGYVTGVRFYKGTTNTGAHVGNLWSSTGTLLATVTFSGETASGWQTATFATPVPVTAGTTYVISYHTNVGRYSYTTGAFSKGGSLNNGPLHAATAVNGLFLYSAGRAFPSSTSTTGVNYFVDPIFTTAGLPSVTATNPANGATGVSISQTLTARFNVPMQTSGLTFTLVDGTNTSVPATSTLDATATLATLTPSGPLTPGVTYTATVRGKDSFGNQMVLPTSWSFTT